MFNNNKCPICESEAKDIHKGLYRPEEWNIQCKNQCMSEQFAYGQYSYFIFEKEFIGSYSFTNEQWDELHEEMKKEILYWKENNRYIANILSR